MPNQPLAEPERVHMLALGGLVDCGGRKKKNKKKNEKKKKTKKKVTVRNMELSQTASEHAYL
jgi:hypothetical protein